MLRINGFALEFCVKNRKFQYLMTKTLNGETLFVFSYFGHWDLFDICDLIFIISINQ
jgi:hypothetical protein